MGGTTPKYQLPYPTGTDRVADGDNAMQALAERMEVVLSANRNQYVPVMYAGTGAAGGNPGTGPYVGRYRLHGSFLLLVIFWRNAGASGLPGQIGFGLPPGMTCETDVPAVLSGLTYPGSGVSTSLAYGQTFGGNRVLAYMNGGAALGSSQVAAANAEIALQGIVPLATGY